MKREFEPKMTVVRFGAEDVIATSGARTVGLSGFEDNNVGNNTFNVGGSTFVMADAQGKPDNDIYHSFRADLDGDGENIGLPNLIYVEPNNSLQEIGSNAFHGCHLRIDL